MKLFFNNAPQHVLMSRDAAVQTFQPIIQVL